MKVLALGLSIAAAALIAQPAAAAVVYNYNFNGTLANDAGGSGTLTSNSGAPGAGSLGFGANLGPTLTGATPLSTYTIDLLFTFDATGGYRKIVDFLDRTSDTGLYNLNGGLVFFGATSATAATIAAGTPARVTLSRTLAGLVTGYVDGAQQFQFTDSGGLALFGATTHFFRDDNAVGGEASSGSVDYIRVFDEALLPADAIAPDGTPVVPGAVPEPATWAMMIAGFGLVGGAVRRRRVRVGVRFA